MKIEFEVSDEELKGVLLRQLAYEYSKAFSADRNHVYRITKECVREIIYKDKEQIIDRIVAQATRECKSKALKKILEGLGDEE